MQEAIQNEIRWEPPITSAYQQKHVYPAKAYLHAMDVLDANDLIRLGARTPLVCQLTKLEKSTVRCPYQQIHGIPSPSGLAPFTDTWYLKSDLRQLHCTLIWHLHQAFAQTARNNARVLIDIYDCYTQIVQQPILNITRAAFVPKLVAMNFWDERTCHHCKNLYLRPIASWDNTCWGCKLYFRYRCRRCGTTTLPTCSSGRHRKLCKDCTQTKYRTAR